MQNQKIVIAILCVFIGLEASSQSTPPPPMPPPPPGLPIDNGVLVLFFVAVIYGIYKAYKFSKRTV